jgi:ABC-2 type transport system ATP-binding protein
LEVTTEKVGYLAEERGLYPKYNIYNQLKYFATLKGMKPSEIKTALDYWFERLNVNEYREKRPDQLSKGNQQKIQLIAALVSDPELLILDEPLSGLDPVNADLFKSVIREEIQKGKFVIMSAHQMALIEEFCQDIVILHKGNVLLNGNLNQIKRGYGRINLTVKADGDILPLAQECGLQLTNQTPSELHFHVGSEDQAQNLLFKVTQAGIPLVKFDLREPTLHEIFVEKVGGAADEN